MKKQINVLYEAFDKMNERFFNGEVPRPTITIQTRGTAKAYGWCSVNPIWEGEEKTHEINITAEYANRPFIDIMETLLHEVVHLDNIVKGIKDCSRGGTYHNKKFKEGAERVGLIVKKTEQYGFAFTEASEELIEIIKSWGLDETTFNTARIDFEKVRSGGDESEDTNPKTGQKRRKSSSIKYVCGCGTIIRATKEVNVICGDCGTRFEAEI